MATAESVKWDRIPRVILTPDQRLRVFVSSTLRELADERAAVRDAVSKLSLTPVMFEIGARPHPPRALYRAYLEQSHVFIGIYWESYGWVAPDESMSGLEDEYRLSGRIPRLLYVKEPAPNRDAKLTDLLETIQGDDTASYRRFETVDELATLLSNDLMLLLTEQFQVASLEQPAGEQGPLRLVPPPEPLTPVLGRDKEIETLEGLISDGSRLTTVTGAGGIGKSRLVVEVGRRCASALHLDVHFVDLTPVSDADAVLFEIAASFGIPVEGSRGPIASMIDYLKDRRVLLLLDNFEHVVSAGVGLSEVVSECPGLQALITSRQVLRVRGETEVPLAPLPIPAADATEETIRSNPTVRLFVQRAQAAQPTFELTTQNLAPVAEICRRLDGLPLAIELAAARTRLLPPNLLLDRLGSQLDLLSSGAADLPERQRTLWNAIDWSYNLLTPDEQLLFAELAVFVDGWTLEAAEAVCAASHSNVLDTMVSLLEKSLFVVVSPDEAGQPRMRMLVPVHDYAAQRLAGSVDVKALRQRHADYFGDLVIQHMGELKSPGQEEWSEQLSGEAGNLRAAVHWWIEIQDGEALGRFTWATYLHYWLTGTLREFGIWIVDAHQLVDRMSTTTRARFRIVDAFVALDCRGLEEGETAVEEALALLEPGGEAPDITLARLILAQVKVLLGDSSVGPILEGVLDDIGGHDDLWLASLAHWVVGASALFAGDLERAEFHQNESVAIARRLGSKQVVGLGLGHLAFIHLIAGRTEACFSALKESVECFRRIHFREGLAYDLQGFAGMLVLEGHMQAAARALAAADATHELIGVPMWPPFRPAHEVLFEQLRAELGDQFTDVWAEGERTDVYVAVDQAIDAMASST